MMFFHQELYPFNPQEGSRGLFIIEKRLDSFKNVILVEKC